MQRRQGARRGGEVSRADRGRGGRRDGGGAARTGAVRPYPFEALDRLTRRQVATGNRLLAMLPVATDAGGLLAEVAETLEELTGVEHEIYHHDLRRHGPGRTPGDFGDAFVTRFRLPPDPEMGVVACDRALVEAWLAGLLEDRPHFERRASALAPRDYGLATYVLLRVLERFQSRGLPPLVLGSEPPEPDELRMRLRADFEVIETTYIVATKASLGFVRLVVPLHMISNLELFSRHEASRRSARRRIERTETGSMPHTLPVSLGSVPLEISELSSLRSGDVLLPAAHGVDFEGLAPEGGGGRLFVDRRMRHHMRCTLRPLEAQGDNRARRDGWSIEIDDRALVSTRTEEQGDSAMSDETGAAAADADEKTEYLMDMAGVEVEFLVGSLEISIRELASLQSGQVLELERDLAEPLDLVVDGRRVARGELVNVEGRLGVRIVSVGSR